MRLGFVVVLLAAATAASLPSATGQGTQASCPNAPVPDLFLEWESSLENLAFDGRGTLYLSDVGGGRILAVDPTGSVRAMDQDAHGIVWGPDDRLYAVVTAGDAYDIQRSTDANVTAFEVYSTGVTTYNGMAFDGAGNLFVSDDNIAPPAQPPDLIRVPRANPQQWEPWTPIYGPNGLAYDAATGALYTVITADQSSPVLRLSATDRNAVEVVAHLSFGAATLEPGVHPPQGDPFLPIPKGLDDLALGPDGQLYITAHLSGELLRVDPATGDACLLASGLEEPTSARFARGFGAHGGKLFVTTWGGTGVSGIALGQVDMHPAGKVWMFDLGFGETAVGPVVEDNATGPGPLVLFDDNDFSDEEPGSDKDAPALGLGLAAGLAAAALVRRRR